MAEGSRTDRLQNESEREYLIRTGKITPFSQMGDLSKSTVNRGSDATSSQAAHSLSHSNLRRRSVAFLGDLDEDDYPETGLTKKRKAGALDEKATKLEDSSFEPESIQMDENDSAGDDDDAFDNVPDELADLRRSLMEDDDIPTKAHDSDVDDTEENNISYDRHKYYKGSEKARYMAEDDGDERHYQVGSVFELALIP
jgi:DNA excision repair protein ERCC-6